MRWRERLRGALTPASEGLPVPVPPADVDAVNNLELPLGAGIPLSEAAARSDEFGGWLDLWEALGDRPFTWYRANTTGEALIRSADDEMAAAFPYLIGTALLAIGYAVVKALI